MKTFKVTIDFNVDAEDIKARDEIEAWLMNLGADEIRISVDEPVWHLICSIDTLAQIRCDAAEPDR